MDGYRSTTYGDGFADVYDDWYAEVSSVEATAAFIAERVGGRIDDRVPGIVIELGSGTSRLAGPIAETGLTVVGLDASVDMLARSRRQHPAVGIVAGDMAELPFADATASVVLIAFNTLFNLPTPSLQRACLRQAAAVVADAGIVVVEAFVPGDPGTARTSHVEVTRMTVDSVVLQVSRTDPGDRPGTGTVSGHHVELRDGEPVRLRPWHLSFVGPDGLDELARSAGLHLVERYADWAGTPFDDVSHNHISVYRHAG